MSSPLIIVASFPAVIFETERERMPVHPRGIKRFRSDRFALGITREREDKYKITRVVLRLSRQPVVMLPAV